MNVKEPQNSFECARVYVDRNKRTNLILKCYFCCRKFVHWTRFLQHMEVRHINMEKSYKHAQFFWNKTSNQSCIEEVKEPSELLEETEMVLIAEDNDHCAQEESIEEHRETLSSAADNYELTEQLEQAKAFGRTQKDDENCDMDEVGLGKNDCYIEEDKSLDGMTVSSESDANSEEYTEEMDCNEKDRLPSSDSKLHKYAGRTFYNMRTTDTEIMLQFIDIIKQHPCHWNNKHIDFADKDKRDESSEQICLELEERWNLKVTPQVARTSVLQLCRWFEREYIRKMHGKRKGAKCGYAHPDYYKKLYEFLPHDHLKLLSCNDCERTFKTESMLLSHKHVEHNGKLPFQCKYCERAFLHQSSLRHHENRHTKQRVYQCNLCAYNCASKTDFQVHRITHTDIRAYVCHLCNASYKSSTSLSVHKRTHGPPTLKCEICGKLFHEKYRLKRHMWQHEAKSETNKAKTKRITLRCEYCKRCFAHQKTLDKHMRVHDDEVINEQADNEQFEQLVQDIQKDLSTNDELETFSCSICELDFFTFNALHKHSVNMHNMELY